MGPGFITTGVITNRVVMGVAGGKEDGEGQFHCRKPCQVTGICSFSAPEF
jgi:hypothetical protein